MLATMRRFDKQDEAVELQAKIDSLRLELSQTENRLGRVKASLRKGLNPKAVTRLKFGNAIDKRDVPLLKTIGLRFAEARGLCMYTLGDAAKLLGVHKDDLRKVENSVGIDHVPNWLIKNAAELYLVPTDYLFGLIEDFDANDAEVFRGRDNQAALIRVQAELSSLNLSIQIKLNNQLIALNTAIAAASISLDEIDRAFLRFYGFNSVIFEDLKGSAGLVYHIKQAKALISHGAHMLAKYKCLPDSLHVHGEYVNSIFPNHNGTTF